MQNEVKRIWRAVSAIVLLTMLVAAASNAATVTLANDFVSTLAVGASANHQVVFTTAGGISEGETVTVGFAAAFDTSGIVEDDVDVEDDGMDLTTATDCTGSEQASVSVSSDIVSVAICAGDGGAVAPGSELTVRIGTNATSSGTGSAQIENPTSVGTYYVSIAGTFGDTGSIALPMLDAGSVSVAGNVSGNGGGGGGGGPIGGDNGCGDAIDPEISSVVVSGVGAAGATVSWRTSENADSAVDYGLTTAYEIGTRTDSSLSTTHAIVLSSLSEGMTYHFRVRSADLCGNESSSSDMTFATSDVSAPTISNLSATVSCDVLATLAWTTNELSDSKVEYGLTSSYGSTSTNATLLTSHSLVADGLSMDQTYHYRVSSRDASGNTAVTSDATFATNQDAAPANVAGLSVSEDDGENRLTWTNPSADFAGARVLACTDTFPSGPADSGCDRVYNGTSSSFVHDGLANGTTYYYGVFSYDGCGQFASGALALGTPSASEGEVLPQEEEEEVPAAIPSEEPASEPEEIPVEGEDTEPSAIPSEEDGDVSDEPSVVIGDGSVAGEGSDASGDAGVASGSASGSESAGASDEVPAGQSSSGEVEAPPIDIPPTTVAAGDLVPQGDLQFFVANRQIRLAPAGSGAVALLSNRPLRIELQTEHIRAEVERVQLVLGESAYLMSLVPDGSAYAADVQSPGVAGSHVVAASIAYANGTFQSIQTTADVEPDGYAFVQSDGQSNRVGGAVATLLEGGTSPWDASPYGQFNPLESDENGQFAWYVPNTTYALTATAAGYATAETGTFSVTDHIVNPTIRLDAVAVEEAGGVAPLLSFIGLDGVLPAGVVGAADGLVAAVANASETVSRAITVVRETPGVEETVAVSIPAVVATTTAATVVLATSFNLLPFLQYLFTSPLLLIGRRKRRAYGVVYNAVTKLPVDLATVRLYRMPDDWEGDPSVAGRLVQSRVTDRGGRYFFLPEQGRYRLAASRSGLAFPSHYLSDRRDDGSYLDVYHGEPVAVNEASAVIAANIPLDPVGSGAFHEPKAIVRLRRLRAVQRVVAVSGIVLSVAVAVIQPSALTIAMVGGQIAFYLLVRRLAAPRKPKSWGIVYDKESGRPLAHAIARVFEPKYHKLLETAVTDSQGRYAFLLGPNEYYTVYEKDGFEPFEVHPIDYRGNAEPKEFSTDVPLAPERGASSRGSSEMTPPTAAPPPSASV